MDPGNAVLNQAGPATMSAIAAAVTPVVMISANAILVSAISSKHDAMSARIRGLAAEWRMTGTSPERRALIESELALFSQRLRWVYRSHILLYVAIGCFIATVISIAFSLSFSLPLLICGVGLTFIAIVMEIADLAYAHRTIALEISDISVHPR